MKRRSTILIASLLCSVGVIPPMPLAAQEPALRAFEEENPDARARELYENGVILYKEGRYEDAIAAWREAWRLSRRPALLYNIANAQERLGQWKEALETLNRYRAFARASEREALDRRIRNLERRLGASAAGEVTGGAGNPTGVSAAAANEEAPGKEEGGAVASSRDKEPSGARPSKTAPWLLVGAGAVGLGAGGYFGVRALDQNAKLRESCIGDEDGGLVCPAESLSLLENRRTYALAADLGFAMGSAALIGGLTWLILPSRSKGRDALQTHLYLSPDVLAVDLRGRF